MLHYCIIVCNITNLLQYCSDDHRLPPWMVTTGIVGLKKPSISFR
mgnify:CR=1 FL=1